MPTCAQLCVWGRLHVRFCVRIAIRFWVRFPAQGGYRVHLKIDFSWKALTSGCNWCRNTNRNPKPFVWKSCAERYSDSYAESDTCIRPFNENTLAGAMKNALTCISRANACIDSHGSTHAIIYVPELRVWGSALRTTWVGIHQYISGAQGRPTSSAHFVLIFTPFADVTIGSRINCYVVRE
jgi:hypothetical protein